MKQALIAVAVFVVLLGAVLATRDRGNVNVGVQKLQLPVIDRSKVTAIELTGASLKKEASGWTVAGPSKVFHAADDGQVSGLLDGLKDFKAEDFITDRPERLAELEVDAAKGLELKVFTDGAAPALDVVLGKQGKAGGTYLRTATGGQVFLTHSGLVWTARRDANAWRKRTFFPATIGELSKLTVTLEDAAQLVLVAPGEGKWVLSTPPPPPDFVFDAAAAQQLAGALTSVAATDFLDGAGDELFAPPHPTIAAELKDGKTVVLQLGRPLEAATDGGVPKQAGVPARIEGNPQVYLLAPAVADQLKRKLSDLRDTTLLSFEPQKVTRLSFDVAGKKTVLGKEAGSWKVLEPKSLPAGFEFDPQLVEGQLAGLKQLRAASVAQGVTEAKAGLVKPGTMITLTLEGEPPQTLKFGSGSFVKGSNEKLIFEVGPAVRTHLETALELFKKRPPPNPGQMQGLENLPPDIRRQLEAQLRQRQQPQ